MKFILRDGSNLSTMLFKSSITINRELFILSFDCTVNGISFFVPEFKLGVEFCFDWDLLKIAKKILFYCLTNLGIKLDDL